MAGPRTSRPRRWPRVVAALLAVAIVAGCTGEDEPPGEDDATTGEGRPGERDGDPPTLATLEAAVRDIAERQRVVDEQVDAGLLAVRDADLALRQVTQATTVDAGLAGAADARDALEAVDPEAIRRSLRELAAEVDAARAALVEVRAGTDEGTGAYLDAEDEVLIAVREHAEANDAVVQLIDRHRPSYLEALDELLAVAERREDLRDPAEAAAAVEVELVTVREELRLAQGQLRRFREERDATGRAVNEAGADATAAFERSRSQVGG